MGLYLRYVLERGENFFWAGYLLGDYVLFCIPHVYHTVYRATTTDKVVHIHAPVSAQKQWPSLTYIHQSVRTNMAEPSMSQTL